jgi:hypothetical protein
MATEVVGASFTPTNAVWVDLEPSGEVLIDLDIALPSPPRPRTSTVITVQLPTSGALDASGYVLDSGLAHLTTSDFEYQVGAATADSLDDIRLSLRASEYTHVGASLQSESGATWYVYSYDSQEITEMPWPQLPAGMQLADLDLVNLNTSDARLNLFAVKRGDGSSPWNWRREHLEHALIKIVPVSVRGR